MSYQERAKAIYVFANEKGGMSGVDTEAINRIILETSSNSAYTAKQMKSDQVSCLVVLTHATNCFLTRLCPTFDRESISRSSA